MVRPNTTHRAHPTQEPPPEPAGEGSSPLTCYHRRLTNNVDAPGPQGPGLRERSWSQPPGRHKTRSTTCAMWYPERRPVRVRGVVGAVDPVLQGLLTHWAKLPTLW